jgi:hypothetical protein
MNHRRMLAQLHPHPPDANELQAVHAESVNRYPATRRQTYYLGEIHRPAKMTFPSITLRMKQRNIHSPVTISDRYAIRFIAIAGRAGKAQVVNMLSPPSERGTICSISKIATVNSSAERQYAQQPPK